MDYDDSPPRRKRRRSRKNKKRLPSRTISDEEDFTVTSPKIDYVEDILPYIHEKIHKQLKKSSDKDNPYKIIPESSERWREIIEYLEMNGYIYQDKNGIYNQRITPVRVLYELSQIDPDLQVTKFFYHSRVHDSYVIWFDTNIYTFHYNYLIIGRKHPFIFNELGIIQCNETGCYKSMNMCRNVCAVERSMREEFDKRHVKIDTFTRTEKFIDTHYRMIKEFLQIRMFNKIEYGTPKVIDDTFLYAESIAKFIIHYIYHDCQRTSPALFIN